MDAQQVFDTIVAHLRTQGHKSLLEKPIDRNGVHMTCAYRGVNGDKCAAGILIADWDYLPMMEGVGWSDITRWLSNASEVREHNDLILDLQSVHDSHEVEHWEARFSQLAQAHKLNYAPPQTNP